MAKDFFSGRVQLLHDTEEHWQLVANSFIPLPGEACVTLDEANKGRVKYGDGIHTWGELPYSNDGNYDGLTIESKNHVIQMIGFNEAEEGQVPSKSSEGLEWFTPVRTVTLGEDQSIPPTGSGKILIPIAGENLGVVKSSTEIEVNSEGAMVVKSIDADKISYSDGNSLKDAMDEVNKRTSWVKF